MMLVVPDMSLMMSRLSSSDMSLKDLEYRKSPTSTLAALPQMLFAEVLPRRVSALSITSSCRSVAVWMNSMTADRV